MRPNRVHPMQIDFATLSDQEKYKLLVGCVVPRPIALMSTISHDGVVNAAPYSFFNAIQIYKEHFNNNELTELIELLCDKTYEIDYYVSHYNPNKNEVMFYAKLTLAIIYDDFINNYKDRICEYLTQKDDENNEEDL